MLRVSELSELGGGAAETDTRLSSLERIHGSALRRFVSQWTQGDAHATEVLIRETFRRASRALSQVDADPATIRPWLFTLARRAAMELGPSRRPRPHGTDARDGGAAATGVPDPVLLALARLSPECRSVIVELFYRGRSVPETARRLTIPEATVKSHAYHGLHALRSALSAPTGA